MKLLSPELEKLAIKSITKSGTGISSKIMASLDSTCFNWEPTQEAWARLSVLVRDRGEVPTWEELVTDPTITEENRKLLKQFKKPPVSDIEKANRIVSRLHEYSKIRGIYDLAKNSADALKSDKIDVDKLVDNLTDQLTSLKTKGIKSDIFTNWGTNSNSKKVVKDLLYKKDDRKYIPLGFDAFDRVNKGLPRGGLTTIAATSGGGKSAMSVVIAMKQALWGAKVAILSLEMSKEEVAMRQLSFLSGIDMGKFLRQELSEKEKKKAMKRYKEFTKTCKRKGGLVSVITPEEDVTIEEALFLMKPYAYDVIVIDYISLLKGMDEDDQWRKLGAAGRFSKRFAAANNDNIILCAQLGMDGVIRYSKALKEHSSNMFSWVYDDDARETGIIEVVQQKARNQRAFNFKLKVDFSTMSFEDVYEDDSKSSANSGGVDLED